MQSIRAQDIQTIKDRYKKEIQDISDKIESRYRYGVKVNKCDNKSLIMNSILSRRNCNIQEIIKEKIDPNYIPCLRNVCIL